MLILLNFLIINILNFYILIYNIRKSYKNHLLYLSVELYKKQFHLILKTIKIKIILITY
jgi:hypothetical protein